MPFVASAFVAADARQAAEWRREFGERLRELREEAGLSQMALAESAGLHATYISGIERGLRNIALVNIRQLARALGRVPADFFA